MDNAKTDINIYTNHLLFDLDAEKFSKEYEIFKISAQKVQLYKGASLLDTPLLDKEVCAVVYEQGTAFYVLLKKAAGNSKRLLDILKKDPNGDKISLEAMQVQNMEQHLVLQLLLNALGNSSLKSRRFNNVTGHLYAFHPDWFTRSRKDGMNDFRQIKCLDVRVSREMRLLLRVTTFSSREIANRLHLKKPFESYPQYVLSAHHTLRRALQDDQGMHYIKKQKADRKSTIDFADISSLSRFEQTKLGTFLAILHRFERQYDGLATLSLESSRVLESRENRRLTPKINRKRVQDLMTGRQIYIVDAVGDKKSAELAHKVQEACKAEFGLSADIKDELQADRLNIRIIHNEEYYTDGEGKGKPDPHQYFLDRTVQHITLEDFTDCKAARLSVVINELVMKDDLHQHKISMVDWPQFGWDEDLEFGICRRTGEEDPVYVFMTIHPDGTFEIAEKKPSECFFGKYGNAISDFEAMKDSSETVQGIVMDGHGNTNVITDTGWYTIPDIFRLEKELEAVDGKVKPDGKPETPKLRGSDKRQELLTAVTDIHLFGNEDEQFYYVGVIGSGMQSSIPRAASIRRIKAGLTSDLFFDRLLPMLDVLFVRYSQLTVVPFPFKYLREYEAERASLQKEKESDTAASA